MARSTEIIFDLTKRLLPICSMQGCDSPVISKRLCQKHYGRLQIRLYREKRPDYVKRQGRRRSGWYKKLKENNPAEVQKRLDKCKEWRRSLKDEIFSAYGGYKCNCCGERERGFLTIDHINGGGTAERRKEKLGAYSAWSKLKKQGFPFGYQVLCMNCNFAKFQMGCCPHKKKSDG